MVEKAKGKRQKAKGKKNILVLIDNCNIDYGKSKSQKEKIGSMLRF